MDTTDHISSAAELTNVGGSGVENRRIQRWIDPRFQRRYALLLLSIVFLVAAVLIGTFWFHSEQVLNTLTSAGVLKSHRLFLLIEQQMQNLLISVGVVVSLFGVFIFVLATFLSHRLVGPMFSIKKSLELITEGRFDSARVKLRSDDEFHDVADLLNRVIDKLDKSK